jgi:hypothetical protein
VELRVLLDGRGEGTPGAGGAHATACQEVPQLTRELVTRPVLRLELVEDAGAEGTAAAQRAEEIAILLRMMQSVGEGLDVVEDERENLVVELRAVRDVAREILEGSDHCGEGAMLLPDDADG